MYSSRAEPLAGMLFVPGHVRDQYEDQMNLRLILTAYCSGIAGEMILYISL